MQSIWRNILRTRGLRVWSYGRTNRFPHARFPPSRFPPARLEERPSLTIRLLIAFGGTAFLYWIDYQGVRTARNAMIASKRESERVPKDDNVPPQGQCPNCFAEQGDLDYMIDEHN